MNPTWALPPAAANGPSSPLPGRLNDVTDIIKAKERELQHFQEMRNAQLENIINEREKLLIETRQKFDMLKDDFQYNLKLIEARDQEIQKLEQTIKAHEKRGEDLERKVKDLSSRLDALNMKDVERQDKIDQEKLMHKRVLDELRTVIEAMRWNAEEDLKSKAFEVENLKAELVAAQRAKEEALEAQRRDLTSTFESIIHKREESFKSKEIGIAHQIGLLDQRFERIQSENLKLKSDFRDAKLMNERLSADITSKDARIRQLSEDVDDSCKGRDATEDALKRQVLGLQSEVQRLTEARLREKSDLEVQLDKARQDAVREREFRLIVEQRLADCQAGAAQEADDLREDLSATARRQTAAQQELETVRLERDQALQRLAMKRVEMDTTQSQRDLLDEEARSLRAQLQKLNSDLQDANGQYNSLQQEHLMLRVTMEKKYDHLAVEARDEAQAAQRRLSDTVLQLEERHRSDLAIERGRLESVIVQLEAKAKDREDELRSKDEEKLRAQAQVASAQRQVADERMEADALRLRLKAQEQQLVTLQQELRQLRTANQGAPRQMVVASTGEFTLGDISLDMPSPMMSEDLQPLTWSPARLHGFPTGRPAQHGAGAPLPPPPPPPVHDPQLDTLAAENEKLKLLVHEMRRDIEEVKARSPSPAPERKAQAERSDQFEHKPAATPEQPSEIEKRLEASNNEILRLRKERKKLMDSGNELRSALLRMENRKEAVEEARVEEARQHNVEAILDWIYSQPVPSPSDPRAVAAPLPQGAEYPNRRVVAPVRVGGPWDTPTPSVASSRYAAGRLDAQELGGAPAVYEVPAFVGSDHDGMEVSGQAVTAAAGRAPHQRAMAANLPLGNTERATRSQAEALQRLKDQRRARSTQVAGQPRRVVNYAVQAAAAGSR